MPPQWKWHLIHELERHFDRMKERHKSGDRDRDDEPDGPMLRNEYARGRGRQAVTVNG